MTIEHINCTLFNCDRCGLIVRSEGAAEALPEGWAIFTYNLKEGEETRLEVCPRCNKEIESVLRGHKGEVPTPEKKPRSDKGIARGKKKPLSESLREESYKEKEQGDLSASTPPAPEVKRPHFDIHTGTGTELHTMCYGKVQVQGAGLKATLKLLDSAIENAYAYGYDWRATLTPQELERVKAIEESGNAKT